MQPHSPPPHRIPVIGLAGGIGSGKSTVARILEDLGCIISDSDAQARMMLTRPDVIEQLTAWWGEVILDKNGRVDRRAVARLVFGDPDERRRIEGLIHPLIRQSREELIEQAELAGAVAVIVDAPLLFEAGLDGECDAVLFVDAPRDQRLHRVRASRGWDAGELDRRESAQMPLEEKRARSDHVIANDGDEKSLRQRTAGVLAILRRTKPRADGG